MPRRRRRQPAGSGGTGRGGRHCPRGDRIPGRARSVRCVRGSALDGKANEGVGSQRLIERRAVVDGAGLPRLAPALGDTRDNGSYVRVSRSETCDIVVRRRLWSSEFERLGEVSVPRPRICRAAVVIAMGCSLLGVVPSIVESAASPAVGRSRRKRHLHGAARRLLCMRSPERPGRS